MSLAFPQLSHVLLLLFIIASFFDISKPALSSVSMSTYAPGDRIISKLSVSTPYTIVSAADPMLVHSVILNSNSFISCWDFTDI